MSIQKFQGPKWYDSVPSSKYKFFQILSSNLKVLDMVHFATQMVHILRVYQLKISLSLSILSLYLKHKDPDPAATHHRILSQNPPGGVRTFFFNGLDRICIITVRNDARLEPILLEKILQRRRITFVKTEIGFQE